MSQGLHFHRKQRRPGSRRFPSEKKFCRGSADAALAWAHAAARMQLGLSPGTTMCERVVGNVFAATDDCGSGRERPELAAQCKCGIEFAREAKMAVPLFEEPLRAIRLPACSKCGNAPFHLRLVDAANCGQFPGAVDAIH